MFDIIKIIEWTEGGEFRARRLVMFNVVLVYVILTLSVLVCYSFNIALEGFAPFYYSFSTVAGAVIGFYAGFKPKDIRELKKETKEK